MIKAAEVLLNENRDESIGKEILSSLFTLLTAEFGESKPKTTMENALRSHIILELLEKASTQHWQGSDSISSYFTEETLKKIFPEENDLVKAKKYLEESEDD